jgi:hypothetical protein
MKKVRAQGWRPTAPEPLVVPPDAAAPRGVDVPVESLTAGRSSAGREE